MQRVAFDRLSGSDNIMRGGRRVSAGRGAAPSGNQYGAGISLPTFLAPPILPPSVGAISRCGCSIVSTPRVATLATPA